MNALVKQILLGLLKLINPDYPWNLPDPLIPTPPKGKWAFDICMSVSFTTKDPEKVFYYTFFMFYLFSLNK